MQASHHQLDPSSSCYGRRRSVDVGGLSLACQNSNSTGFCCNGRLSGRGWGGWDEGDLISQSGPRYAELLTEMRTHTLLAVNEHHSETPAVELPNTTRARLIESLDSWNFEPHKLPEEELVECTLIIFEALFRVEGFKEAVRVSFDQIPPFVRHLRQIYRSQNSYHNFQHALDVLQATHTFLRSAGVVPPVSVLLDRRYPGVSGDGGNDGGGRAWRPDKEREEMGLVGCLSPVDLFTVYVAAIGHDVGHPGFSNVFMKNAKTPLSAVYDDKSALEQMHCTLLLHVMRHHGMSHLLDTASDGGMSFRKMLVETVLATDMSVHVDFMKRFEEMVVGGTDSVWNRKLLMCQALVKCADISNPSRPHRVSQYWANALMEEWSAQASLERHFQLPATVKPSEDPVTEAKGQVFFINAFAKPLLELTARAIPEMDVYAKQCAANLKLWGLRCTGLETSVMTTANVKMMTECGSSALTADASTSTVDTQNGDVHTDLRTDLNGGDVKRSSSHSSSSSRASRASSSSSPAMEDFCTAFPLALPEAAYFALHQEEQAAIGEVMDVSGGYYSPAVGPISASIPNPRSPAETESIGFWVVSASPTTSTSTKGTGGGIIGATATLRAAYEASVRKRKIVNRNSWGAAAAAAERLPIGRIAVEENV